MRRLIMAADTHSLQLCQYPICAGTLPEQWSNISGLVSLDLDSNLLTGVIVQDSEHIPACFGTSAVESSLKDQLAIGNEL